MDSDRENLLVRIDILSAYVAVMDDPGKLIRVCASISGGHRDAVAAVAAEFAVSDVAAEAILDLQVRRFVPRERERVREELDELRRRLELGRF